MVQPHGETMASHGLLGVLVLDTLQLCLLTLLKSGTEACKAWYNDVSEERTRFDLRVTPEKHTRTEMRKGL